MGVKILQIWSKYKYDILIWVLYLGLVTIGVWAHEPWRDEAQAWLLVRDLSLSELWGQLRYEGHLMLWYLVLYPFVRLDLPFAVVNVISAVITVSGSWLIYWRAPFRRFRRGLLLFCVPLLYFFSVVARPYCLIPLACALMAITYRRRHRRPLLFLLSIVLMANTHVHMWGLVGVCLLVFMYETWRQWKAMSTGTRCRHWQALCVAVVLLIVTVWPLLTSLSANIMLKNHISNTNISSRLIELLFVQPLEVLQDNYFTYKDFVFSPPTIVFDLIMVLMALYLCLDIYYYRRDWWWMGMVVLWQLVIDTFIWNTIIARSALVIFILLYFVWIRREHDSSDPTKVLFAQNIANVVLTILLVLNAIGASVWLVLELCLPFSASVKTANYVRENLLSSEKILVTGDNAEFFAPVAAYLPSGSEKFYQLVDNGSDGRFITFVSWDKPMHVNLDNDFREHLRVRFPEETEFYYFYVPHKFAIVNDTSLVKAMISAGVLREIFDSGGDFYADERVIIYAIDMQRPFEMCLPATK